MWADLFAALGLMLVLEGIMPFANPAGVRRVLLQLAETDDQTLRIVGLVSMLAGVGVLYLIRW